jgi:hypothetical protein
MMWTSRKIHIHAVRKQSQYFYVSVYKNVTLSIWFPVRLMVTHLSSTLRSLHHLWVRVTITFINPFNNKFHTVHFSFLLQLKETRVGRDVLLSSYCCWRHLQHGWSHDLKSPTNSWHTNTNKHDIQISSFKKKTRAYPTWSSSFKHGGTVNVFL